MKRIFALAFCAVCGFAAVAADWTYTITSGTAPDKTSGTISDGEWTFAASVAKNSTDLTVGAVSADPGADATLDFSKPITDADANSYTLVNLDPKFGAYANKTNLKTLKLPTTGLAKISTSAFENCTSLTSVSPFLPDSVTEVAGSAFAYTAVEDSLFLRGATLVEAKSFGWSSVTNVTFGSALKKIRGGWCSGSFDNCKKLVTVNFDPATSGAATDEERIFGECSKLTGSIDLSGFVSLGKRPFYWYGGSVTKMAFSSDITSVVDTFFHSLGTIKEMTFNGGVPPAIDSFFTAFNNAYNANFKDLYIIVPEANKDDWAPYCENGVINNANSYVSTTYIPKAKSSNIFLIYKKESTGGNKGYWVYDGESVASTNGLWKFTATKVGAIGLVVGACEKYPETAGELDFSQEVTNEDGEALVFSSYANLFHTGSAQVAGYDKVTAVKFSEDSTSVGASAFRGCTALAGKLTFPDVITAVGEYAFCGCTGITELKFGSGLASVGKGAFADCSALETVTPCFPDTLTELGNSAFNGCPITNACVMNGIVKIDSCAIRNTKIPSIYIGPKLKTFVGGYCSGAISLNTALTNITIDAGVTNAEIAGEHAFYGNTKVVGTLDLSGFKTIGNRPFDGLKIDTLVIGQDVTKVDTSLLRNLPKLGTLIFKGPAPTGVGDIFNEPARGDRIGDKQNVKTYVYRAHEDSWKPYAANGVLTGHISTWARDYICSGVTDLNLRKLVLVDPPPGFMILVR